MVQIFQKNLVNFLASNRTNSVLQSVRKSTGMEVVPEKLKPLVQDEFKLSKRVKDIYKATLDDELIESVTRYTGAVRKVNMGISGTNLQGEFVGGGGTKTAYEVEQNGVKSVYCLPNNPNAWEDVLEEPTNTKLVKQAGVLANDVCEIEPVKLNGHVFPVIKMKPYTEHDFIIFDKKNSQCNEFDLEDVWDVNKLKDTENLDYLDGIIGDVEKLVKNNIDLDSDSVNLALTKDGQLRLYINDLPGSRIQECIGSKALEDSDCRKISAKQCLSNAMSSLLNAVGSVYYQDNALKNSLREITSSKFIEENLVPKLDNH